MSEELPRSIAMVRSAFETIADDFDRTRNAPWPAVERFVEEAHGGAIALDLGCGNGRHTELLGASYSSVYGIDVSRSMLKTAIDRFAGPSVGYLEASATAVPLRTDTVDLGLYIATLHHLPDRSRRVDSLDELARVLHPNASALISGWSIDHDRFDFPEAVDTVVDWTLPSGETVQRFYHLYDAEDFTSELSASNLEIEEQWVESGNCYAIASPEVE